LLNYFLDTRCGGTGLQVMGFLHTVEYRTWDKGTTHYIVGGGFGFTGLLLFATLPYLLNAQLTMRSFSGWLGS
jgi:hypothetical protein